MTENAVLADKIERLSKLYDDARAGIQYERMSCINIAILDLVRNNLPAILAALRSRPEPAAGDVEAAALRVADATLCQWGKPNDCGREGEKCLCEEAAKAALAALPRPEADEGAVAALRAVMGLNSVQTLFEAAEEYPHGEEDVAAELSALKLARAALAAAQEGAES